MKFKDESVKEIIANLVHQYNLFVSNQFINYYLMDAKISKSDWVDVEDLINANKYYEAEGYDLEKLYEEILAFARFLTKIKEEVLPRIKAETEIRLRKLTADNQILYKMTMNNAPGNVKVFFDLVSSLYVRLKKIDREKNGEGKALYSKIVYVKEIEKLLNA
jgi:hypothetical protein